ncbi:MAG: PQQ-binding-like beta-propeller repeat protein [Planctomycetes bacterium]|nr:PQQ-binding-like beta-propeller repeat protein [Planctomycetota bacterium]
MKRNITMRSIMSSLFLTLVVAGSSNLYANRQDVLGKLGINRGICIVCDDSDCELAIRLVNSSDLLVYVHVLTEAQRQTVCRAADAAGLYGTRIYVGRARNGKIQLADNIADGVVAKGDPASISRTEALRVMRPGAKALLGKEVLTKSIPDGIDDWSHHYHGPDNNPQSNDQIAQAPFLTQFIGVPRYSAIPQTTVISAGRIFMAFGHVAWKERAESWLDTLIAVNGYNGTILWKRKLRSGIMIDRSTMIATPEVLYLADHEACQRIDAATGRIIDHIAVPTDLTGGTFWKWMALEKGVLYALIGEQEAPDPAKRWKRTVGGWPWGQVSDGFNVRDPKSWEPNTWQRSEKFSEKDYQWGFAKTLLAIDVQTKEVLWHHNEKQPIDSRAVCMKNGRLYFSRFSSYIGCLDTRTGKEIWRKTVEMDPELFKAIGPYCPFEFARTGWRTTIYARCSDDALYFVGPQVFDVTAISGRDGHHLWTYHAKRNPHVLIRDDGLYITGASGMVGDTHKLEPLTGEILKSYKISRVSCTRTTGSTDSIYFRGGGDGTIQLDPATGNRQWISPMRPSCFVGTVVANGQFYWMPGTCDCNLQMFGLICCAPAGDFQFDQTAEQSQHLETWITRDGQVAAFRQSPDDWPTYRANNARNATTRATVPTSSSLLWTFTPKATFKATAPVTAGGSVFVSGSDGIVRALDMATGHPRWTAYTGGAVRYPPSVSDRRVFVGSGDGYAYAFEAATGKHLWRFRAAPTERKIPVYGSLQSTWPVATGVLVSKDVAYFAAGMNNYDGTHVYALDAASGTIKWQNNDMGGTGKSVGVQGDLLLYEDKLYLAGGNSASPAVFDINNGRCLDAGRKNRSGRELWLTSSKNKDGETIKRNVVAVGQPFYSIPDSPVFRRTWAPGKDLELEWPDPIVATANVNLLVRQARDGWHLVAQAPSGNTLWEQPMPTEPIRWGVAVDAQGRIVVVLRDSRVLCFGNSAQ